MAENNQHSRIIFLASFLTLIAAGVGFAVRGGILTDWSAQFGFTQTDLGGITGGGLTGFGVTILICSLFADMLGYKALLLGAFTLHALSAVLTFAATPVYATYGREATYQCLYWGMFLFALGNGLCETAINPLVATLYPNQKTHYLNILHAGWPGGLILGGLINILFVGPQAKIVQLRWELALGFFLIPVLLYGMMTLMEKFPISEARAAGVKYGEMFKPFLSPIMLLLLILHAMVGYVELGTDSWITNIMNNLIKADAFVLFVYTSGLMFVLRFFAGPIVEKINPLGLLMVSAVLACIGLFFLGSTTTGAAIFTAATVYGLGKTFFWPTLLGVASERFPQGGALVIGSMGGIGMLSAGLLGGPGIGFKQDYFASQRLKETSPTAFERYVAKDTTGRSEEKSFLWFKTTGLDGQKLAELEARVASAEAEKRPLAPAEQQDKDQVLGARLYGGQMALKVTALVPAAMAVLFFVLVVYFRARGGYRVVHITQGEGGGVGGEPGPPS